MEQILSAVIPLLTEVFSYLCTAKLRKECNLLEMSVG